MKEKISVIIPTVNAAEELDLAIKSLQKNSDHSVELVIVIDPDQKTGNINDDIIAVCKKHKITPYQNKRNLGPYGSWNAGAGIATTDWLIFATDDQYFAPHWDSNLMKYWAPKRLVAGRLVEPGSIAVYKTNIEQNFGKSPAEFSEKAFTQWCKNRRDVGFTSDGFFIPLLQSRQDWSALGGYPEVGKFGTAAAVSNDYAYIQNAKQKGYEFGTASDSYSYHFQASSWKKKALKPTIAAVVLTQNNQKYLKKCLQSLTWVDQIIIIDGGSEDATLKIAAEHKAHVIKHAFTSFAAQRNFALTQGATYDWILMVDADEEIETSLAQELQSCVKDIYLEGVEIPRKNYIFGKWVRHTDWYPDHRLVFFRPKLVRYSADVHERADFVGERGFVSTAKGNIIHHNYDTVEEFVVKNLVRYPKEYASVLSDQGIKFSALDMVTKSAGEFMRRFFLCEGYKDGLYGLLLSLLMGAQNLVAYVYLWELQGKREELTTQETQAIFAGLRAKGSELSYWLATVAIDGTTGAAKLLHRARRKTLKLIKGI